MAASNTARMDALEAKVDALVSAVNALVARETTAPAKGKAKSDAKVALVDTCACGATFRFGRKPADVKAAGALGLCGAKGRTSHRQ